MGSSYTPGAVNVLHYKKEVEQIISTVQPFFKEELQFFALFLVLINCCSSFWLEDSPTLVYVYSHWIHRRGSKYIAIMYYCHKLRRLFSLCAVTLCTLSVSSVISSCICFCFVLFFLMPLPQQSDVGFLKRK